MGWGGCITAVRPMLIYILDDPALIMMSMIMMSTGIKLSLKEDSAGKLPFLENSVAEQPELDG